MLDLTVVVCCRNSETMIGDCLLSIRENGPRQIFLVDGGSTDRTLEIAGSLVHRIFHDQGHGLANARNMGIDHCETKYICFAGPDNVMPTGSLAAMIDHLETHGCAIVSAVTVLRDTDNYWGWAQNVYRIRKYFPGFKDVVGTPTLFRTAEAKQYRYDPFMKNSDDTEICTRMAAEGLRFAIAPVRCQEIGFDDFESVFERWTRYGRGDYLFYLTQCSRWGLKRKLKSYAHPLVHDFFLPLSRFRSADFGALPFLGLIVFLRYYGWLHSRISRVERQISAFSA